MQISFSTLKSFIDCEAEVMAYKNGEWDRNLTFPESAKVAMLNGSLVHTFFEGESQYEKELEDNKETLLDEKGVLKEDYKESLKMIKKLSEDKLFMKVYQGIKEPEIKGSIGGVEFHGFIDCLNVDKKVFCDIKTVNGSLTRKIWNDKLRKKEHWSINRKYTMQMAIYKELLNQNGYSNFTPIICAVSKEEFNDTEIFYIPDVILNEELNSAKRYAKEFDKVFNKERKPKRCEACNYCKSTKENKRIKSLAELI